MVSPNFYKGSNTNKRTSTAQGSNIPCTTEAGSGLLGREITDKVSEDGKEYLLSEIKCLSDYNTEKVYFCYTIPSCEKHKALTDWGNQAPFTFAISLISMIIFIVFLLPLMLNYHKIYKVPNL